MAPVTCPGLAGILDKRLAGCGGGHRAGFEDTTPLDGDQHSLGRALGRRHRSGRCRGRVMAG